MNSNMRLITKMLFDKLMTFYVENHCFCCDKETKELQILDSDKVCQECYDLHQDEPKEDPSC